MKQGNSWSLRDGLARNAECDVLLEMRMRHARRDAQRQWRHVRPAAAALLSFAYGTDEKGKPLPRRRVVAALGAMLAYGGRGRSLVPVDLRPRRSTLAEADVRAARREIRIALARVVLADPITRLRVAWTLPWAEVQTAYYRAREDVLGFVRRFRPQHLVIAYAAAEVLGDAVLWLRHCALCARLFFKVRRQELCGNPRCRWVYQGRKAYAKLHPDAARTRGAEERKGPGRTRKPFERVAERVHTEWLQRAERARGR
jgi:hypothetical protein